MHFSCLVFLTPNVLIPSDQNMSQQAKYSNTFKLYTTDISQIGIASEEEIFKTKVYVFQVLAITTESCVQGVTLSPPPPQLLFFTIFRQFKTRSPFKNDSTVYTLCHWKNYDICHLSCI